MLGRQFNCRPNRLFVTFASIVFHMEINLAAHLRSPLQDHRVPRRTGLWAGFGALLLGVLMPLGNLTAALPTVTTPDPKISEVFTGNWNNTLKPCEIQSTDPSKRPWMVDVGNHYGGWYPGIDALYQTKSYLFCEKNLPLVLTGWQHTVQYCQLSNGGVQSTQGNGVGTVFSFKSQDGTTIGYPLLTTGTIDLLLNGDSIYRFSQDKTWLRSNIQSMRNAAGWLEGWIDDKGMLQSQDYAHDSLMRPGTDGTAQAEAYLAFNKLAAMENVLGNATQRDHATAVANQLAAAARTYLWDSSRGYFMEYAVPNDVASSNRLGSVGGVSSTYHNSAAYAGSKAIDGVLGYGTDVLNTGAGAGASEWVANNQTTGAWIQVNLSTPTAVNSVTLYNRTGSTSKSEAFATGTLTFSDGTTVPVTFRSGAGSSAVVSFNSRTVSWVKFTGDTMQAAGGGNAGLAEFEVHPTAQPYLTATHGMTDTNFALVGAGIATDAQAAGVWQYFQAHEDSFYTYNGLHAPTWTAESPTTYTGAERNAINPYKDTTAIGRVWNIDVMMRTLMGDGAGIYKTVGYANAVYDDTY